MPEFDAEKLIKTVGMQRILEGLIEATKGSDEDYCKLLWVDLTHAYNNYMRRYENEGKDFTVIE